MLPTEPTAYHCSHPCLQTDPGQIFAAGPVRPAVCYPAAGEGPHGRQQRSAVKLNSGDYVGGVVFSYRLQCTRFGANQRHIREWQVGPYNVI